MPKFVCHVVWLAFCEVGDLCPSGMDVRLVDGARLQGNQVLANAIAREGGKHLVVIHKLHQHCVQCWQEWEQWLCYTPEQLLQQLLLLKSTVPGWIGCLQASESHWFESHKRSQSSGKPVFAGLQTRRQGSVRS